MIFPRERVADGVTLLRALGIGPFSFEVPNSTRIAKFQWPHTDKSRPRNPPGTRCVGRS
ncbi:hypothetical protein MESS2_1620004 [Mesorhizobium metallidurans STM 2683]|uniref:Uncharacterized protein n=1 Tax=Mesorhizobium metallidurans STM 2683 TaxID=1297569 RepID=M5ELK8_9HYPH|nr:hypothetical protein MESS2_1620004 [Mesorhizobium metallidurans STM 2683]